MQEKTTEIFRDAPVPRAVISNIVPSIISMIMVLFCITYKKYFKKTAP